MYSYRYYKPVQNTFYFLFGYHHQTFWSFEPDFNFIQLRNNNSENLMTYTKMTSNINMKFPILYSFYSSEHVELIMSKYGLSRVTCLILVLLNLHLVRPTV